MTVCLGANRHAPGAVRLDRATPISDARLSVASAPEGHPLPDGIDPRGSTGVGCSRVFLFAKCCPSGASCAAFPLRDVLPRRQDRYRTPARNMIAPFCGTSAHPIFTCDLPGAVTAPGFCVFLRLYRLQQRLSHQIRQKLFLFYSHNFKNMSLMRQMHRITYCYSLQIFVRMQLYES